MSISPALKKQIDEFLEEFRSCSRPQVLINRSYFKNENFIANSGIQEDEIQEILLKKLSSSHYKNGPEKEINSNHSEGVIYKFEYPWNEYNIYIKLKLTFHKGIYIGICISFHD